MDSKILLLVRSTHCVLQMKYCTEIDEFLTKVFSRGW